MFDLTSVRFRLVVSVVSNVLRAFLIFVTGFVIARALNPVGYGDLMFLLGSFVAIRSLFDMGSASAFFTFISQSARGNRFYLTYFIWLTFQFISTLALLWLLIPSSIFEKIWLGNDREVVVLAFVAVFMQQQVWQMVGQIGEAMRKTVRVQVMNIAVALIYCFTIILVSTYGILSIKLLILILIWQYIIATVLAYLFLRSTDAMSVVEDVSMIEILAGYWRYCKPLIALAFVSFFYDFSDKWLLQKFGGAEQQGYFQIANQFAAVSLLATTSILNVFWKEIADAWNKKDRGRVEMLYRKVSRGLVMLGAIISGLLIPWSEQIVVIFLGNAYASSWPVLAVMLLYPIHQSMGQIGGTMFLASGQTRKYMFIGIAMMLISIPISFFVLAPSTNEWIPGLEMGALGMACKMVALGIVSVNIQAWVIARFGGWKPDWIFQVVGIPMMIGSGFIAKMLSSWIWSIESLDIFGLIAPVLTTICIYSFLVITIIFWLPWLVSADRSEIKNFFYRMIMRKVDINHERG